MEESNQINRPKTKYIYLPFPFGVIDGGGCWESGNRRMGMMRESWSRFVLALRFCEWVGEESWRSWTMEASAGRKRDQASD
ncbi:unnamed protein product [Prunus armeniaca]|uniref:Uncharacterized protein n=1 Tax=Prunus armeniaca TaxID=36596 RepID=A0A6J5VFW5_PRUAR|nr:unnamed protein product [Prunus armeniaca]